MRIIKTKQDFDILRRARVLPAALLDQVENYFNQLGLSWRTKRRANFAWAGKAYIVVLEVGDNVRDLGNVWLNREDCGLLGSCPEYVSKHTKSRCCTTTTT